MSNRQHWVFQWILVLCALVLLMIVLGGVTRLTGSGLSIVEWKPLMGAIPPLTQADWLSVFAQYQKSPQYQLVNRGMTLGQFQWIFFWEYIHRLLGRIMGLVFIGPWIWFWFKGLIDRRWAGRLLVGFLLGGLQGLLGWIMVASGLVNEPRVSPYRLAAHLSLAFFILAYFWRMAWSYYVTHRTSMVHQEHKTSVLWLKPMERFLRGLLALLVLQIVYGAFVAGLRAGFMYNTFPSMEGQFFPRGGLAFVPLWTNFTENPLLVQWIHRMLGWSLMCAILIFFIVYFQKIEKSLQKTLVGVLCVFFFQFLLGVMTLVSHVALPLAVIHQIGAAVVLLHVLWLRWEVQRKIQCNV